MNAFEYCFPCFVSFFFSSLIVFNSTTLLCRILSGVFISYPALYLSCIMSTGKAKDDVMFLDWLHT